MIYMFYTDKSEIENKDSFGNGWDARWAATSAAAPATGKCPLPQLRARRPPPR